MDDVVSLQGRIKKLGRKRKEKISGRRKEKISRKEKNKMGRKRKEKTGSKNGFRAPSILGGAPPLPAKVPMSSQVSNLGVIPSTFFTNILENLYSFVIVFNIHTRKIHS